MDLIPSYWENLKKSQEALQKYAEQIAPFKETFEKIALEAKKSWQPFLNIIEMAEKTRQMWDSFVKDWQEFNKILFSLGWFPAGEWTATQGRYILKLYKENKLEQIDKEIAQYYTAKRISEIYNKWATSKKLRKFRLKIIKDALDAHIHRKYTLSIIVLLTQIEGAIRDYIEEYGSINHAKLLEKFKSKISNEKQEGFFNKTAVIAVADTILWKLFLHHGIKKKTKKTAFTRHSVIHGMNITDLNRVNSTKLILLLNYIINKDVIV